MENEGLLHYSLPCQMDTTALKKKKKKCHE